MHKNIKNVYKFYRLKLGIIKIRNHLSFAFIFYKFLVISIIFDRWIPLLIYRFLIFLDKRGVINVGYLGSSYVNASVGSFRFSSLTVLKYLRKRKSFLG